jgi:hypothetical protein
VATDIPAKSQRCRHSCKLRSSPSRSGLSTRCAERELEYAVSHFDVCDFGRIILPRSAGGKTVFDNVCLACPTCNRYQADRTSAIDPATQGEVPLFHPHRDNWKEHFVWNENATELVALSATGRATIEA